MPAPPPSALDGNQVLQHAFEDATGRLRVDAEVTATIGEVEVIIDHTEDSIRLGDGISLITATTVGSDIGLDVNIINTLLAVSDSVTQSKLDDVIDAIENINIINNIDGGSAASVY